MNDGFILYFIANLNDRSMNGDHDSEIAAIIEDTDMVSSRMNGNHVSDKILIRVDGSFCY